MFLFDSPATWPMLETAVKLPSGDASGSEMLEVQSHWTIIVYTMTGSYTLVISKGLQLISEPDVINRQLRIFLLDAVQFHSSCHHAQQMAASHPSMTPGRPTSRYLQTLDVFLWPVRTWVGHSLYPWQKRFESVQQGTIMTVSQSHENCRENRKIFG